ncbi:RidA family protein [Actinoplanes sp. NPDC049265]|uniref:RidA family protein n=1 Tax=Actinoplanes sp. NPDC049265 TaxID=3363902 RepID=UPI00371CBC86
MTVTRSSPSSVFNPTDQISQSVSVAGRRLIHLAGQVAWDAQGNLVGGDDYAAQSAQVARNIEAVLAAAGATRDDIVDETVFVVGYTPELLHAVFDPLRAGMTAAPASTLVAVSALFAPGFLIEVRVVAAVEEV